MGGVDVQIHVFIISASAGDSGHFHDSAALARREGSMSHWIGGCVGLRTSLYGVQKREVLSLLGLVYGGQEGA
jgi:hypothetical protein